VFVINSTQRNDPLTLKMSHVASLEEELGLELLLRTTHFVELTTAEQFSVKSFEQIVSYYNTLKHKLTI